MLPHIYLYSIMGLQPVPLCCVCSSSIDIYSALRIVKEVRMGLAGRIVEYCTLGNEFTEYICLSIDCFCKEEE